MYFYERFGLLCNVVELHPGVRYGYTVGFSDNHIFSSGISLKTFSECLSSNYEETRVSHAQELMHLHIIGEYCIL